MYIKFFNGKHKKIIFFTYFIFFLILSLNLNKDIVPNSYNFGRHWDWSLFASEDIYRNYLKKFFFSIKENSLGYMDVIGTNLGELLFKLTIYIIFFLLKLLNIDNLFSIAIINKLSIFIILPLISSLGVFLLCKKILSSIYHKNCIFFLSFSIFSNLLYSFSLPVIFDIHGGALNRQISLSLLPFCFLFLFNYLNGNNLKHQIIDRNLTFLVIISAFMDISNIFYFFVIVIIGVMLKESSKKMKLLKIFSLIFLGILLNSYWLVPILFIDKNAYIGDLLKGAKLNMENVTFYSSNYFDIIFMTNTPHNLIKKLFSRNILIYIPYLTIFLIIILNLMYLNKYRKNINIKKIFFFISVFVFTTILNLGVYDITKTYHFLYNTNLLIFLRGPVRFIHNLMASLIFFLAVTFKEKSSIKEINRTEINELGIIIFAIIIWLNFLLRNSNLIVKLNQLNNNSINHESGALYNYDNSVKNILKKEKELYRVLPIPSTFSPIFIDNIKPKSSQGSDSDNLFLNKGIIFTPAPNSQTNFFLSIFIDSKQNFDKFLPFFNIKYIWFRNIIDINKNSFDFAFIKANFKNKINEIIPFYKKKGLYLLPNQFFLPRLYIPKNFIYSSLTLKSFSKIVENKNYNIRSAIYAGKKPVFMSSQKKTITNIPKITFVKINSTKYRVMVEGANKPYVLVFSESFHKGWRAYVNNTEFQKSNITNEDRYGKIVASYFDGEIKEGTHRDIFLDRYTFETLGKKTIPEERHLLANGYANSWYITPEDSGGKSDYELIIEFAPQRYFYIGLFISFTTLIASISYLIVSRIKNSLNKTAANTLKK